MEIKLWLTFLFMFALGGFGIWLLTKGSVNAKRISLRGKFFIYFFISLVMFVSSMYSSYHYVVCFLISLIGFFEICFLPNLSRMRFLYVWLYVLLSMLFVYFCYKSFLYDAALLLLVVLGVDGFSQIFGNAFGANKISESISPNKTWEGFFGAYISVLMVYFAIRQGDVSLAGFFLINIFIFSALAGDLMASYLKRKADVKDFGKIIPFHGGVLDRFDSLIVVYAVAVPFYMVGIKL